jgi:acyl-CoA hydrolase
MPTADEEIVHAMQSVKIARGLYAQNARNLSKDPGGIAGPIIARTKEAMHAAMSAMLQSFGLRTEPDLSNTKVNVVISKRAGEDWVEFYYDLEAQSMRLNYRFSMKFSKKALETTVASAERFVQRARQAVARSTIEEHDLVKAASEIDSDGHTVPAGSVGTVVSVYQPGEAFAVEFPDIEDGPAVVTVRGDEVEPAESITYERN